MLLRSELLSAVPGVRHGFSCRRGGASVGGGRAGLDLGPNDHLAENRARFGAALGVPPEHWVEVEQVHGVSVISAPDATRTVEADAIYSAEPGPFVAVRTADCAPILIAGLGGSGQPVAVAAVHAGWRSATGGILAHAVEQLRALGAVPAKSVAAIGPCIGVEAFEVGPEVSAAASASIGGRPAPGWEAGPGGRPHLDLPALITTQLMQLGFQAQAIEWVGGCTYAQPERFFSYRRDGKDSGRQLSGIQLSEAAAGR